jgi:hypothetical protein
MLVDEPDLSLETDLSHIINTKTLAQTTVFSDPDSAAAMAPSLQIFIDNYFPHKYSSPTDTGWLLCSIGGSVAISRAMTAIAYSLLYRETKDDGLRHVALQAYGAAVSSYRRSLTGRSSTPTQQISAAQLLSTCESLETLSLDGQTTQIHSYWQLDLMERWKDSTTDLGVQRYLKSTIRLHALWNLLVRQEVLPPGDFNGLIETSCPSTSSFSLRDLADLVTSQIFLTVNGKRLLQETGPAKASLALNLLSRLHHLEHALDHWMMVFVRSGGDRAYYTKPSAMTLNPLQDDLDDPYPYSYVFPDWKSTVIHMTYWMSALVSAQMQRAMISTLGPHTLSARWETSGKTCQEMADRLCMGMLDMCEMKNGLVALVLAVHPLKLALRYFVSEGENLKVAWVTARFEELKRMGISIR